MFRVSRFQHLMQGLPRGACQAIIDRHGADRYTKGFDCLSLLTAQVFGHLSGCRSLRELETGYNAHRAHHYHLGTGPLRRTTLADACARRNPQVFAEIVQVLMATVARPVRKQAAECLRLLDSTSFTLKGRGFAWAEAHRTCHTQGLKLHLVFDPGQAVPVWQDISAANVNDVTRALEVPLQRGATYVFDKGYCDYNGWAGFEAAGAWFVTRLKRNAQVAVLDSRPVPAAEQEQVLSDELIRFSNRHPGGGRRNRYTAPLRRITVHRPDHATPLVLVTNDLERPAAEIAACYRARWQIELFFKWIKQNLRISRFFGRSENAVRIQILCALIAYLLVALYRARTASHLSMLRVLNELRVALFQRPAVDAAVEHRRRARWQAQAAVQPGLFA